MRGRKIVKHVPFEDKDTYIVEADGKKFQSKTNKITAQFIQNRYVVLRDFIPKDIITFALDSWKVIEHNKAAFDVFFRHETEITFNSPKSSLNKSHGEAGSPMGIALNRYLKDRLKTVLDLNLGETYAYCRKYERGAYLKAHRDRPSCEISITTCLDYQTDDKKPWKIWLDNSKNWVDNDEPEKTFQETQAIPNRKRESVCVELEVGDVLLYQGPNVIHWRDFLVGEYSYHVFAHFYNREGYMRNIPSSTWSGIDNEVNHQTFIPPMVLEFDGRVSRYHPHSTPKPRELEERYEQFRDDYENRVYGKRSEFCNNYGGMETMEKKKKK